MVNGDLWLRAVERSKCVCDIGAWTNRFLLHHMHDLDVCVCVCACKRVRNKKKENSGSMS